jgi:transcriptional regulator with XRE-family HTH domain
VKLDLLVNAFGKILKETREAKGLSQQELADYSETDRAFISKIERGISTPSILTLFKLAEVLKIKPKELIEKVEQQLGK